jgi:hypothetical protein
MTFSDLARDSFQREILVEPFADVPGFGAVREAATEAREQPRRAFRRVRGP